MRAGTGNGLLEVANEVFASEGLSVQIDEIASRAGVGVGTVYRHFPTKESLFEAVIASHKRRLIEKAKGSLDQGTRGKRSSGFFPIWWRPPL
ncbi:TetR/AcrR family transcriptional regulator [Paenibacillus sp. P26]|nr:TetR/AcrR family transcriptional regulator [Paenibacillus sp. P26]